MIEKQRLEDSRQRLEDAASHLDLLRRVAVLTAYGLAHQDVAGIVVKCMSIKATEQVDSRVEVFVAEREMESSYPAVVHCTHPLSL